MTDTEIIYKYQKIIMTDLDTENNKLVAKISN